MSSYNEKNAIRSFLKRMLTSVLLIVGGVYLALTVLLFLFQERIIFHPSSGVESDPSMLGMPFEEVVLTADDGVKSSAWFIPADSPVATVLFCHGNAGNISHRLDTIKSFHDMGLNVMIFDYRGYGRSEGTISERGLGLDAAAAYDYLLKERKLSEENIVVVGRSFGGAVAAKLAATRRPAALILESAFTSIPDMGSAHYPFLPTALLTRYKLSTKDWIKRANCPKLIAHSPGDEIVPYKQGRRLYELASEPKTFLELRGDHNNCYFEDPNYVRGVKAFVTKAFVESSQ